MSVPVQKVAVTCADGFVILMSVVLEDARAGWKREATDAVILAEIMRASVLWQETDPQRMPIRSFRRVSDPDLGDRGFRDAWRDDGARLTYDMPQAREIRRQQLRAERAPVLAQLDADYLRADEVGNNGEKQRIAREKQRLRDITQHPAIEAATTVEELKAVTLGA